MLPRLEAEQTQRMIEALVYANQRGMDDQQGRTFVRRLEEQAGGVQKRREPRPKVTLDFARRAGIRLVGEEVKDE